MRTRGMLSHKDATPQDLIPLYTERSRPRRSERERAAARACTCVRVRGCVRSRMGYSGIDVSSFIPGYRAVVRA